MRRSFWWAAMLGLSCFVSTTTLLAQDRGDRGDRGERGERGYDRGERGERGGERGERPSFGGGERPSFGGGERPSFGGGERPSFGGGERPSFGGGERPSFGGGERPSFGGGDRGSYGGDRGSWGGERRFDPTEIFRRMDQNGNGQLEPSEVSERGRRFVADAATKAGLDPAQPLSIERLVAGATGQPAPSTPATPAPTDSKNASSTSAKTEVAPLVPGFGVALSLTPPPGFDVPLSRSSNRFQRPLEERFEKAVLDRVNELLQQMDTNKDGKIDYAGEEGKNNRWQGDPKASDLNSDGKLDREELCVRIAKLTGSKERSEGEARSSERGGGERGGGDRGGGDRGGGRGGPGEAEDPKAKIRRYAESSLRRYDENRSGVLEKDEIAKMSPDSQKADLNGDGVITLDELVDKLSSYGSEGPGGGGMAGGPPGMGGPDASRRGGRSRGGEGMARGGGAGGNGSVRFLTSTERLPKGLPSWFAKNDVDGDGQVTMAEYSSTWNDTVLAEFSRYDLNADGTITPQECLQGEKDRMARR